MTDILEFTSREMFFDFHNAYKGGDVPPAGKDAWKDIYIHATFLSDQLFLVNDLWKEYGNRTQTEVDFYKKARQATFNHLPSEDKAEFLSEFKHAINSCIYTNDKDKDFNNKIRTESVKEFKEMFNSLSVEEKQFMIGRGDDNEILSLKEFGERYNIPEFKKIDISSLNPEIFSRPGNHSAGLLINAPYLSLNEMDFLIKSSGCCNELVLEKYINKAMAQAEAGGAERMLNLLQSRKDNLLGAGYYVKDMPEMLLDLAHTNPEIGSDLLAEGFRIGYRAASRPVEPKGSFFDRFGKDPMLQEAQDKNRARIDFKKISNGEKCPLSEVLLKYNEEHLDDILTIYSKQFLSADEYGVNSDTNVLLAAVEKGDYLSDESRAKIATTVLKDKRYGRSEGVDICLDFACQAKNTGTVAFDELEKTMQDYITPMIQRAEKFREEQVNANRQLKNVQKQQEKYCQKTGVESALKVIENLQTVYKEVTDLDVNTDKAYLSKERAEALVSCALKGEKVSVDLIEEPKGVKGFFTGNKEKNRICKQNEALKRLEATLEKVAVFAQENTNQKNDIKKISKPYERRNKLTGFATMATLQFHSGHILEEDTLSELKNKNISNGRVTSNVYDKGTSYGDDALKTAQSNARWAADSGGYIKNVLRLAMRMKDFQANRKENAKEKNKEAKKRIALQQNDMLMEKAKNLEGLQGEERTPVAKNIMLEKARRDKANQM